VRKSLLVAAPTVVAAAALLLGVRQLGATSAGFAFLVVWAPMTWLGTVSRVFQPRLPRRYHELRDFERDPWLYEVLGVRLVKRLLRRGPLAVFNPGLHLPAERSPERLAELEQGMNDAEASHIVLLVAMLGVVINAAARGWWVAAGLTLLFDVLMNGYPVILQRYNRALLHARFPTMQADKRTPLQAAVAKYSRSAAAGVWGSCREQPVPARHAQPVRHRSRGVARDYAHEVRSPPMRVSSTTSTWRRAAPGSGARAMNSAAP
jgi:Glycosyl-4,4'-diaponeurosporenoate acyltransferase